MRGSGFRRRRLLAAWACSAALHVLVILVASRASWVVLDDEPRPAALAVVWISDLPTLEPTPEPEPLLDPEPVPTPDREPEQPAPQQPSEPAPQQPSEPAPDQPSEPESERLPEAATDPPAEPEIDGSTAPEPAPASEPPSAAEPPPTPDIPTPPPAPETTAERDADESTPSYVLREADLEEAWRRAREQLERAQDYRTFSLDDVIEAPLPEEPGPSESIFEAAERYASRGGPSMLAPNRARTRVGRAIAELCNALTGGFGISLGGLNLGSVCADPGESAKLFAHLKPAYLRSRPVCTEVEVAGEVSEDTAPTIKCRLVLEEDMDELPIE
jgi:hypothetical protein